MMNILKIKIYIYVYIYVHNATSRCLAWMGCQKLGISIKDCKTNTLKTILRC